MKGGTLFARVTCLYAFYLCLFSPILWAGGDKGKPKPKKPSLTQMEWARTLVKRMPFINDPEALVGSDREILMLLSGKGEGSIKAVNYKKALFPPRVIKSFDKSKGVVSWVEAGENPTTLYYFIPIPVSGKYTLSVKVKGKSGSKQYWNFQNEDSIRIVNSSDKFEWKELKPFSLSAGIKRLGGSLPVGGAVMEITYAGPCGAVVEPKGGWKPDKKISYDDMVRTMVMAWANVIRERRRKMLPSDARVKSVRSGPVEYEKGKNGGYKSVYRFKAPADGIYTLYLLSPKAGEYRAVINGCGLVRFSVGKDDKRGYITTRFFSAGDVLLSISSDSGALVSSSVLIEKRDESHSSLMHFAVELGLPADESSFEEILGSKGVSSVFEPIDDVVAPVPTPSIMPTPQPVPTPSDPFEDGDRGGVSPITP